MHTLPGSTVPLLPLFLALLISAPDDAPSPARPAREASSAGIQFLSSLPQARRLSARSGLPIVLTFGAAWCGTCRQFKRRTLPSESVQALADSFHWVYVEIERNVSMAREFNVRSTPQMVVIKADGTHLGTALGALLPRELVRFLSKAKERSKGLGRNPPYSVPVVEANLNTPLTWSPSGYRARAVCFSHVGYGPLNVSSQSPAQILRLGLSPRTPSTLAKGQFELRWTEAAVNVFAQRENDFRLDYLTINSVLSLSYGITDTFQVGLEYSDVTRTNSVLDPIVDGFHDAFGLGDSGRDDFPSGDNIIELAPKNGVSINSDSSGSEARDLRLTLQHNLTCGSASMPAISFALDLGFHAGGRAQLRGDNPWSVSFSTALARRFGQGFYTYAGLGYAWHGLDQARGLPLEDSQWSGMLAFEWRYGAKSSWVLQYLLSEGVAKDRDPFDKPTNEINIGWKREIAEGTVFEIGLIENIIEVDNSPDFGLHFGLQYRF